MAKLSGPLLSFGARGSLGKTMVISKWRGVPYARSYVVPANPQTAAQTSVRATFALLREMWKLAPSQLQDAWNAFASGRPFTGMNKEVGENVRVLNGEADMSNYIASPGAGGGLVPLTMNATTGGAAGEIDVAITAPAAPSGWTLTKAVAIAFLDQDPAGIFEGRIEVAEDTVAPYDLVIDGLPTAQVCIVCAWLVWTKPDGKLAYSVSLTDSATSGA